MKTKNFSNHLQSSTMICFIHPRPTPFFPTSSCQFCMCCLVWSPSLRFVPHEGCNFHAALACKFTAGDLPVGQHLLQSGGKCPVCLQHHLQQHHQPFSRTKLFLNHLWLECVLIKTVCPHVLINISAALWFIEVKLAGALYTPLYVGKKEVWCATFIQVPVL